MIVWEKFTILIVEDDKDMLSILCEVFEAKKAKVYKASNGTEALDVMTAHKIDFVLSDVQMPIMTGTELLKKIREIDPEIPIVLLATGEAQITEDKVKALGGAGLIYKPFKFTQLLQQISRLFENTST